MSRRNYTNDEIKYIKNNYKKLKYKELAKNLGRSIKSVRNKIVRLNLTLSKNEIYLRRSRKNQKGFNNPNWKGGNSYTIKQLIERLGEEKVQEVLNDYFSEDIL